MTSLAYLNGKFLPTNEALININTHALHYGCGYFAGLRGYWNLNQQTLYLFRFKDHLARFKKSGQILGIKPPAQIRQLKSTIVKLVKLNRLKQNIYIRPLVFISDPILSKFNLSQLNTNLAVTVVPLGDYLDISKGTKAMISSWRRTPANSIPPQAKPTGLYLNTALAHTQARKAGFDEAILLTQDGFISEGAAENIFMVKNNQLITPSPGCDILLGITRDTIIKLTRTELKIEVIQKKILPPELLQADEIFLTGTGAQVSPVIQIGRHRIGSGKPGPITRKLQKLYFDIVSGNHKTYSHWLTPVMYT